MNPYQSPVDGGFSVRDYTLLWRAIKAILWIMFVILLLDVGLWLRFRHVTQYRSANLSTAELFEWFADPR